MEAICYVKRLTECKPVVVNNETKDKRFLVLTTVEARAREDGSNYAAENDLVFTLFGDRATNFRFKEKDWVVIKYSTVSREYNDQIFQDNRLSLIAALG